MPGRPSLDRVGELLLPRRPAGDETSEDRALANYLGIEGVIAWPTPGDVAKACEIPRSVVVTALEQARDRWHRAHELNELRTDIAALLQGAGGVATIDELAAQLLAARGSVEEDEGDRGRLARAALRAAVELETAPASWAGRGFAAGAREHPHDYDLDYLLDAFAEAARLPGLSVLFDPAHNPLFRLPVSGDGAIALREFFQAVVPETGAPVHDFTDPDWGTRFLGDLYRACGLGAPFIERFFDLGTAGTQNQPAGFVGMIVANSFMKREFGKKLIEEVLPRLDLTHVVNCDGVAIPGHGIPTAILFGRNRAPVASAVRTVMGIKGDPPGIANAGSGRLAIRDGAVARASRRARGCRNAALVDAW